MSLFYVTYLLYVCMLYLFDVENEAYKLTEPILSTLILFCAF